MAYPWGSGKAKDYHDYEMQSCYVRVRAHFHVESINGAVKVADEDKGRDDDTDHELSVSLAQKDAFSYNL